MELVDGSVAAVWRAAISLLVERVSCVFQCSSTWVHSLCGEEEGVCVRECVCVWGGDNHGLAPSLLGSPFFFKEADTLLPN